MRIRRGKGISKWLYYFTLGMALIFVYKFVSDFGALWSFAQRVVSVIMPFIMGVIVAYLFYRPVTFLERLLNKNKKLEKVARPISIFAIYIIAILLVILLINCVMPPVKESIRELINNFPNYIEDAKNYVSNTNENSILKKAIRLQTLKKLTQCQIIKHLFWPRLSKQTIHLRTY